MKNALFSPFFILSLSILMIYSSKTSFAQTLEEYVLQTQEDVNYFITNCACLDENGHLDGSLNIGAFPLESNITDLAPLSAITSIEGDLLIQDAKVLTSLEGLEQLTMVGRSMRISGTMIKDLKGLDNLEEITESFEIGFNEDLEYLVGLEKLTTVGGIFMCRNNPLLVDLKGLSGLKSIGQDLVLIAIGKVTTLEGLENLTYVGRSIGIGGSERLETLDGLGNVKLDVLHELWKSSISINKNPELVSIAALKNIDTDWNIKLEISSNAKLEDLTGLDGVTTMGDLSIMSNASLKSLADLSSLEVISNLEISSNPQLTDLAGLEQLKWVKGNLNIYYQGQLKDLKELSQLTRVDSILGLVVNAELNSLTGLEQLEFIGVDLNIVQNEHLIDLDALSQVETIGKNVIILNNQELSTCCLVDCWVENDIVKGEYRVEVNKTDGFCNALSDIAANCTIECRQANPGTNTEAHVIHPSTLQIFQENNQLSILRNPATASINTTVKIYHITGQLMEQQKLTTDKTAIDISHYATGSYIIVLETEGERQVERFVKW